MKRVWRFDNLMKGVLPVLFGLLPALCWAVPVLEQPQEESRGFERCLGLPDGERLACYDRVALQRGVPAQELAVLDQNGDIASTRSSQDDVWAGQPDGALAQTDGQGLDVAQNGHGNEVVEALPAASAMERMWELREDTRRPHFSLQAYHTNYVLFGQYSDGVNRRPSSPSPGHQSARSTDYRHVEAKFQLSIRSKLVQSLLRENDSIWFGYTQVSQWQVWSPDISRPFRATSYKPEIIYITPIQYQLPNSSWALRMAGIGLVHESNGQSNPLSRSWNRVYLGLGLDSDDMSVYVRFWKRFPESHNQDDNPDITTYMGRADIRFNWDFKHDNTIGLTLVSNLRSANKGSVQLDYYFPLSYFWGMGDYLRGYVQVFHGYGETITDYNFRRTAVGIGVAIKEW